jgi:hypothetical protein
MMAARSDKILHADASVFPTYESADLDFFQSILNDILQEYESIGQLSISDRTYLKDKLAVAIFRRAATGDRDYARLKRSAIEAVSPVPLSDPNDGAEP